MEVTDPDAGTVSCTLPEVCYAAVGMAHGYIELRRGAELVDTTDEMFIDVLDCIDADGEQAKEYKPLIAEAREAVAIAKRAAEGADAAASHQPRIGESDTWEIWDIASAKYVDTGVAARGARDIQGEPGKLFQFMGCSLNMSGNVPAEYTTPRFSYTMSIPEGVAFIENGWYFKKVSDPTKPDVRSLSGNNILQMGNKVFASLTFIKVPVRLYEKKFSTKAFVKYATADGTTVEAVEADYDAFTPAEIADAVLTHQMATQADKDYAAAIKAAIQKE